MKLEQISLPVKNAVEVDYWSRQSAIHSFFVYRYEQASFEKRAQKLLAHERQSAQLSDVIRHYMEPFGISEKAEQHLQELAAGALAIVGGQQSGVLTGPLYSVYKVVSVLKLAQEQREQLQMPIVPIFWIAGEDHDLDEINHTYTIVDGQLKKRVYGQRSSKKTMASMTSIDQQEMELFIAKVFKDFGETAFTQQIVEGIMAANHKSATYSDFFAYLMTDLFAQYGLLLIDAAYPAFRQLETSSFERLIRASEKIAQVVVEREQAFAEAGYIKPIEATIDNANLFYVKDGERFLLERKNGYFTNALAHVKFTEQELIQIAQQSPQSLSNNVVTRPLMQEMMLPVLAFVGGPGELAYWATLGEAFNVLGLDMPIFAPRMHITVVTRQVERLLQKHDLTAEAVMQGQATEALEQFVEQVQDREALAQIEQMQQQLEGQYDALARQLEQNELSIEKTLQRNKQYHMQQFEYLRNKLQERVLMKHSVAINQFNTLNAQLLPDGGYQERLYSPYQYMNVYGHQFIEDLMLLPITLGPNQFIVKY